VSRCVIDDFVGGCWRENVIVGKLAEGYRARFGGRYGVAVKGFDDRKKKVVSSADLELSAKLVTGLEY